MPATQTGGLATRPKAAAIRYASSALLRIRVACTGDTPYCNTSSGKCSISDDNGDGNGDGNGSGGGEGDCDECVDDEGDCSDCDCCEGSCNDGTCQNVDPIVIDLNGTGFQLTNAQNGVRFDFFGTGRPIQIPWTAAGANTAWLVLDRKNDGRIDTGADLFSNVAPQPGTASKLKMGFKALAVYDLPANGGNGDSVIDSRDEIFSKLLVWVDRNHNGISDPGELVTVQQAGIQSISLHYQSSQWTDAVGNQFRYRSAITFAGGGPAGDRYVYDVMLGGGNSRSARASSAPTRGARGGLR